jgi:hypothetical protein
MMLWRSSSKRGVAVALVPDPRSAFSPSVSAARSPSSRVHATPMGYSRHRADGHRPEQAGILGSGGLMWSAGWHLRSCRAARRCDGQEADAPLTPGYRQLLAWRRSCCVSRAHRRRPSSRDESVELFMSRAGLAIETDPRLTERVLSGRSLPDWREHLRRSFEDELLPGGRESSGRRGNGYGMRRGCCQSVGGACGVPEAGFELPTR